MLGCVGLGIPAYAYVSWSLSTKTQVANEYLIFPIVDRASESVYGAGQYIFGVLEVNYQYFEEKDYLIQYDYMPN